MDKPRRCPFCGKPAEATSYWPNHTKMYRCMSTRCPAHACIAKLEDWNKRAWLLDVPKELANKLDSLENALARGQRI